MSLTSSTFVFNRGSIFHVGGQTIILGKKKYYNAASGFKKRLRSNQRKILPLPTYYYILTSSTNAQKCKTNQFSISNLRNLRDHHQTISQCDKIINEVSKLVLTNWYDLGRAWHVVRCWYNRCNVYSSVPNRHIGPNKRAGGKILKNIKRANPNKAVQGGFFSQN